MSHPPLPTPPFPSLPAHLSHHRRFVSFSEVSHLVYSFILRGNMRGHGVCVRPGDGGWLPIGPLGFLLSQIRRLAEPPSSEGCAPCSPTPCQGLGTGCPISPSSSGSS